uniref:PGG domain-containing protein n=2 Tax=Oryza TaxID=4527 RepID=A0A0E0FIF3_ORYNI
MASSNGEQPPESPKEANAAPVAAKLAMASGRDGCERLKDLVSREDDATTMVVAMATSQNVDDTGRPPPPRVIMDPQLLMAARNGACQSLESLLLGHEVRCQTLPESHLIIYLPEPDEGAPTTDPIEDQAEGISATDQQASGAVYSLSLLEGLTLDSDENSALHVVAASGDSQAYVECTTRRGTYSARPTTTATRPCTAPLQLGTTPRAGCCCACAGAARVDDQELLARRKNKVGETALHRAVRAGHSKVVEVLMKEDPGLAGVDRHDGTSPLYLAVSLGRFEIAWDLLDMSSRKLSYSGPDGQNVLHVAVQHPQALSVLLEKCKNVEVNVQQEDQQRSIPLLLHLTSQSDKNGSTPLHFAASLKTSIEGFTSRLCEHFRPKQSPTTLLLGLNESAIYQPDNRGSYPIHVAASNGILKVVITLLKRYPDCATLRDIQGRTFFHVAVEKKRRNIVAYVCERPGFSPILNMQDSHGDTALHLAVKAGVCLNLSNEDGLTPRDLSWIMIPARLYSKKNPRYMISQLLALSGGTVGYSRQDHFFEKYSKKRDEVIDSNDMTSAAQVLGISSALIATVTFAAAFTLPGGYRADEHTDGGTPTLAGSYPFDAFIISNSLAFICSLLATVSLLYSGIQSRDISIRRRYYAFSMLLMQSSTTSFTVAFAMGMYLVLAPVTLNAAVSVCIIAFVSLLPGNMEIGVSLAIANTLRIRLGIWAAMSQARPVLLFTWKRVWSCIIIFGLPGLMKIHRTKMA